MKKVQTIDELLIEFENHLRSLQRSKRTIRAYGYLLKPLKKFMAAQGIECYDLSIGRQFVKSKLGDYDYATLTQWQQRLVNGADALYVFQTTGKIYYGKAPLRRKQPKIFYGEIGLAMQEHIAYRTATFELLKKTQDHHTDALHGLFVFLTENGVKSINEISKVHLLSFIKSLSQKTSGMKYSILGVVKKFLSYLYTEEMIDKDHSQVIKQINYKKGSPLPSFFSPEEISLIEKAVDRANASGKRDYVMVLLASRLGLRVSDIGGLKFENINWDKGIIEFAQFKTGKEITLPLLPELGNALIDYLKYGRPVCDEPCCFVQHIYPYKTITPMNVKGRIRLYIFRSGISLKGRHKGAHALRHSFATNLLGNKTPLPVISEALGHSHTASTIPYLRVDKEQLRQCALDVSMVTSGYYQQKGGFQS